MRQSPRLNENFQQFKSFHVIISLIFSIFVVFLRKLSIIYKYVKSLLKKQSTKSYEQKVSMQFFLIIFFFCGVLKEGVR